MMEEHSEPTTLRQYGRHFSSPDTHVNVIKDCICEMGGREAYDIKKKGFSLANLEVFGSL